jgi:hypothetical protein
LNGSILYKIYLIWMLCGCYVDVIGMSGGVTSILRRLALVLSRFTRVVYRLIWVEKRQA